MSVLVKGMGVPLMCDECPCYNESDYSCNATGRGVIEYRYDGRPDNCPLVEIPTPHGRLIDENELLRHKYGFSQTARVIIKNTDAVIEAEVSE